MSLKGSLARLERRIHPRSGREQAIILIGLSPLMAPEIGVEPFGPDVVTLAHRPGLAEFLLLRLDIRDWVDDRFSPEQQAAIDRAPRSGSEGDWPLTYSLVPELGFCGDGMPMYLHHAVQWVMQARDGSAPLTVHDRGPDGRLSFRCGPTLCHPAFTWQRSDYPEAIRAGWGRDRKVEAPRDDFGSLLHLLWYAMRHGPPIAEPWGKWKGRKPTNIHKQSAGTFIAQMDRDDIAAGRPVFDRDVLAHLATMDDPPLWPERSVPDFEDLLR